MNQGHPLKGNQEWRFAQYAVGMRAPIRMKSAGSRSGHRRTISHYSSCREGLVSGVRHQLSSFLRANGVKPGSKEVAGCLILDEDGLRRPGASYLFVARAHVTQQRSKRHPKAGQKIPKPRWWLSGYGRWYGGKYPEYTFNNRRPLNQAMVQDFIDFCDAIIGPLTVLLNPSRFEGNWWQTSVKEAMADKSNLRWYGIDNSALAHPALVSLYSGLARQCALMVRCGLREEILGEVDTDELTECLTNSDPQLALRLAKKMRKWIEVPTFTRGYRENLPVPAGSFPKIPALHKAIYKHGFAAAFGRGLEAGWALTAHEPCAWYGSSSIPRYRGIHSFMGVQGENRNGERIRQLAKKAPSKNRKSE